MSNKSDEKVLSEVEFPKFRISVLEVSKNNPARDIAQHNQAMSQIIDAGGYEVKSAQMFDAPTLIQLVVVMTR